MVVNPDKTKLSFALQLAAPSSGGGGGSGIGSAAKGAASAAGGGQGGVMPATVWRSGERRAGSERGAERCGEMYRASNRHIRHRSAELPKRFLPAIQFGFPIAAASPTADAGDGATFIKWCGLLLNTETLELQGDYTRCGAALQAAVGWQAVNRQPWAAAG